MEKSQALEYFQKSRQSVLDTVETLIKTELTHLPVEGDWAIREVLCHLVGWETSLLQPLITWENGGDFVPPPAALDHNAWNESQVVQRQNDSLESVLSEMQRVRQQILAIAERIPAEAWQQVLPAPWGGEAPLTHLFAGLGAHEHEHLEGIQARLLKEARP